MSLRENEDQSDKKLGELWVIASFNSLWNVHRAKKSSRTSVRLIVVIRY
ncbi:hypothetical protein FOVG_04640 [Fusarium oxysporum f. sp. pisi HDV247]|uniref:Uncharacterized protein n=1 Tax=Fusarium oxysporum f. sp. pisi HDV247 TaxID=1080344 RepID=W9PQT2_FUSOX|nr:hypothetical protein FOVG_04640 [Fusarium oxysporum f. sp. pisi HDV247]